MTTDVVDTAAGLEPGDTVTVDGWSGIAFRVVGPDKQFEVYRYLDEYGNFEDDEDGDGEWVEVPDRLVVVMVGDDRHHIVDVEDVHAHNEPVCSCGQLGCQAEAGIW